MSCEPDCQVVLGEGAVGEMEEGVRGMAARSVRVDSDAHVGDGAVAEVVS